MPIVGLTDRGAMFPQIGILRKGDVKKDEKKPGADLTYFRFDSDDQDAVMAFNAAYGAEPRSIRVFLPFQTTNENFEAWREEWVSGGLKHRCDGQICVRWQTPQGTYSTVAKPCPGGCKQVGRLRVIVPELRRMAYVTVLTTSIHDIIEIDSNLLALETSRGDLRGIPLLVKRVPREISTPGADGKRVRREKWLISIEAQPQWVDMQLTAMQRAALGPAGGNLALPEYLGDDEDDDAAIEAEATPTAPEPKPAAVSPQDEARLNAQLKAWCLKEKKAEKVAEAYFQGVFGSLTFEQKQAKALALGIVSAETPQPDPARDNLIASIEGAFRELAALGKSNEEIQTQVARLCGGETSLEDMSKSMLVQLAEGIFYWRDQAQAEFKRKAVGK